MIKDIYYSLKNGISNIIKWFPVIWKDKDWDKHYIYVLLYHKFKHMEEFFRSNDTWSANALKTAHELMIAKNLCKRLSEDNYLENATTLHEKKFKPITLEEMFVPCEDKIGYSRYVGDSNKEREKSFERCCRHSDYMEKQDREYLFDLIKKKINGWWD